MVHYYTVSCRHCHDEFIMTQGEVGWVDSAGNFGMIFHPTNQPVGKPKGKWTAIPYQQQVCASCGEVIFVLQGVLPKPPKPIQAGPKENEKIHLVYLKNSNDPKICPICKGTILDATQIIPLLKNREKVASLKLSPLGIKDPNQKCPKCKQGLLELKEEVMI